eukprot:TRINITY_DN3465_c0_g1_i1.p1 TRINITY_DN3465_c0_g1~~TRINITY_DN3465_c0_g1_i1.p1  ORF type:complete len:746 (+),score=181.81 TRINITY_DN3465_c0_g1_i1:266-2503(+)
MSTDSSFDEAYQPVSAGIAKLFNVMKDNEVKDMKDIFNGAEISLLHSKCYSLANEDTNAEELYNKHGEEIKTYLKNVVLADLGTGHGNDLLERFISRWNSHQIINKWLYIIFQYLDQYYIKHNAQLPLRVRGIHLFHAIVFEAVKERLVAVIIKTINENRCGNGIDFDLLGKCIGIFREMPQVKDSVYQNDLVKHIDRASRDFYREASSRWLEDSNIADYLRRVEVTLEEEANRMRMLFKDDATQARLVNTVQLELLKAHLDELVNENIVLPMLQEERLNNLSRLFQLMLPLAEVGCLTQLANISCLFIEKQGQDVIQEFRKHINKKCRVDIGDPIDQFVRGIIRIHSRGREVFIQQFHQHQLFERKHDDTWQNILNRLVDDINCPLILCNFIDRLLKPGGEKWSDTSDPEDGLEHCALIFTYLSDKDVFGEIYRNMLSRRLLRKQYASLDLERLFISKLKTRCGAQFTSAMEGMLTDLQVTLEIQRCFEEWLKKENVRLPLKGFDTQVLTTSHWPGKLAVLPMRLPEEVEQAQQFFLHFYNQHTKHRRLTWMPMLHSATMSATFGGREYELNVTAIQACVLNMFNDRPSVSVPTLTGKEIQEKLNIPMSQASRALHSLSCSRYKLLLKRPSSNSISPTDTFSLNTEFSSPKARIRLPLPQVVEPKADTREKVNEDRSLATEACIVRVMKARRQMNHTDLINEVMVLMSTFKPTAKLIKQRIEVLIERDYIERSDDDPKLYVYVA